jgi:hypothetical protein
MVEVFEQGRRIAYSFEDLLKFHGHHSPAGVAHAYKVLERGLPALGAVERRELEIDTAFGGPGARDAFEMVARAVSGGRYRVDAALARPALGRARERFVFRLSHRGDAVTLVLREGFVTEAFIDLARLERRTDEQERRLAAMKLELATRVMDAPAEAVYDME